MMQRLVALWLLISLTAQAADETIGWKASGKGGAVAAGGADAVAAGIRLLADDGNAADAAAATLLALTVTDYGLCAMGGEIPLLIYDAKKQEVKAISGVGRAPLDPAATEWYFANGIPANGSMKAAPTPGHLDLCVTLLKRYGTQSFEQAVTPTMELLREGKEEWHPNLAATLRKCIEAERTATGTREDKLTAVRDRFYLGDIADELEAWYIDSGSFLRKQDLAAHETLVSEPVSVNYRGYTVYKCGPWTQGPYLCQTLRLLEGFPLSEMQHLSTDYIHTLTEALKLGFADRDAYYGDPLFVDVPMQELLSDQYTQLRRPLIDMNHASMTTRPGDPLKMQALKTQDHREGIPVNIPIQDTTTCVVADRWGNVVSATPSCNLVGNKPGPSGITQGNRLRSLNTTPDHPNRIQPGKRPRVTLTPTLVFRDGKPILAISVAGGDLQDQTTLNVLLNHIEFGMLPEQAVVAPRFSTQHHQNSFNPVPDRQSAIVGLGELTLSEGIAAEVIAGLQQRGHQLTKHQDGYTKPGAIGHPVMIYLEPQTGIFHAAGDPKAKRHAAALD